VIVLVVVLGILLMCGLGGVSSYNSLVTKKHDIDAKWAEVQNQMQRRADLIPNIVGTVKGIAGLEERVFTKIAEARSQLLTTIQNPNSTTEDKIAADNNLTQAMRDGGLLGTGGRFLSITENYPQLKSNESFLRLQDELAGTENRLAVERKRYNESVQAYDTKLRQFPSNLTAKMFGFKEHPYFEAPAEAKQAPKVNFSKPS
jgi:LemA protein